MALGKHALCEKHVEYLNGNITKILTNTKLVAFFLWFAAKVDPREPVDYADTEQRNHYFLSTNTVLLRESLHTTADILTMNQLRCWEISFLGDLNREHFSVP